MSTNIGKNGLLKVNTSENKCLINNFSLTNTETNWSFGTHTFSNGIVQLTGTSPIIQSSSFTVNPTDIIVFEFTVSLPTPSTTTGGPGLYLGTKYGDSTTRYYYSDNSWSKGATDNNPYFIWAYNSSTINKVKTYILGSSADINLVPPPEYTNTSYTINALQVPNTTTYIRSGYNSNSSMVINFSNPRIYKINHNGICETDDEKYIADGYISFNNIIEY